FFFGDYQGLRLDQGRTVTLTVPTPLMRQGIFTEIPDRIFDPATGQQFAGNTIPAGQIDPIAQKVANLYPLPNQPGLANNYIENNVLKQTGNAGDFRLDYHMGQSGAG